MPTTTKEADENWRPRTPPCWASQDDPSSASEGQSVDVEEGVSVDDSQNSSTNLSLDNNNDDDEPLGSIEMVNTMNGRKGSPTDGLRKNGLQIEVENIGDIANTLNKRGKNGSPSRPFKTPPPKAPRGALDFGTISPDSSKDSREQLLRSDSSSTRKKSIRFSPTFEIRHFTPNPEEFENNPHSKEPYPSCGNTARLFLTVYALPFMHGASSNITTLYLLVELTLKLKINTMIIGACLASTYLCRLIFALLSRVAPKVSVLMGSLVALLGFGLIYASQDDNLRQNLGIQSNVSTLFIIGNIMANTNEVSSAMHIFVRDQFTHNIKEMGNKLKKHYLIAKFARVASFGGGGVLYHYRGVGGLALLGGFLVSLQIMWVAIFFILDTFRAMVDHQDHDGLWGEMKPRKRFSVDCSLRAAVGRRRMLRSSMSKLNRTLTKYYPSAMPNKVVRIILPICIYGRTISSAIVWNVISYTIHADFHQNYLVIGGIFASITAIDFVMSFVTLSEEWNMTLKTNLPSPNDIYILSAGVTLSLALVAVPHFTTFVVGLGVYALTNNAMRTFLYELQGTTNTAWDTLQFHLIRCTSTVAALFSIPSLNSLHKRLPLVLAIWFALLTTSMIIYIINVQVQEEDETNELDVKNRNSQLVGSNNRISRRPEKNLEYGEQVMLSRLIKGKDI